MGKLGLNITLISYALGKTQILYNANSLNIKVNDNNFDTIVVKYKLLSELVLNFNYVSKIFKKKLLLFGIGFRCWILKKQKVLEYDNVVFKVGFSNDVYIKIPLFIRIICLNSTFVLLESYDRIKLLEFSSLLRNLRFIDMYKGKGIFYINENVCLKQGKNK